MKTVELADATASLANYAKKAGKSAVLVTDKGRPIAALVGLDNADWESIRVSTDPKFLRLIERSRERYRREGGLTDAQVREQLGVKPIKRSRRSAT